MATRVNGSGKRAGIYVRISKDSQGEGLGVKRQRDDCERLCEQRGWLAVDVYADNDISAFSGKARPEYTRLLDDLLDGILDSVVVWHPDRLHRSPAELENFVALVETTGAAVATVTAGDTDLSTPEGRLMARITGAVARKESEDKSRRLRRKHEELAQAGRFSGGGRRAFGYEPGGMVVRKDEAKLIRDAIAGVTKGATIGSIARDWNRLGVLTPAGNQWRQGVVRKLLLSGRIAGFRTHRGEVVADAEWPAIVDPATWERFRAVYTSRNNVAPVVNARKYLLAGFAFCGLCGTRLTTRNPAYICSSQPGVGGCGRIRIVAGRFTGPVPNPPRGLDQLAVGALFAAVEEKDFAKRVGKRLAAGDDDVDLVASIAEEEGALAQLADDHYVSHLIPRKVFLASRDKIEARLEALRSRLAQVGDDDALGNVLAARQTLRDQWDDLTLDQQRARLGAVIERVVVHPSGVPGRFDPNRVKIVWKV